MKKWLVAATVGISLAWMTPAFAGCSRAINVPVAPFGYSVVVKGADVSGIFPDLLRSVSAKSGCTFNWSVVPRARLEASFEYGTADMILAATQSSKRDQYGRFIPLVWGRATLVSLANQQRPPISTMRQLIEQKELRIVLVRGFDYGPAYRDLIKTLTAEGRSFLEPDPITVARMLVKGMADVTIFVPSVILNVAQNDARVSELLGNLRFEALDELPWIKSGIYLSTKSLAAADVNLLEQALTKAAVKSSVYGAYAKALPPDVLKASVRPLR